MKTLPEHHFRTNKAFITTNKEKIINHNKHSTSMDVKISWSEIYH